MVWCSAGTGYLFSSPCPGAECTKCTCTIVHKGPLCVVVVAHPPLSPSMRAVHFSEGKEWKPWKKESFHIFREIACCHVWKKEPLRVGRFPQYRTFLKLQPRLPLLSAGIFWAFSFLLCVYRTPRALCNALYAPTLRLHSFYKGMFKWPPCAFYQKKFRVPLILSPFPPIFSRHGAASLDLGHTRNSQIYSIVDK